MPPLKGSHGKQANRTQLCWTAALFNPKTSSLVQNVQLGHQTDLYGNWEGFEEGHWEGFEEGNWDGFEEGSRQGRHLACSPPQAACRPCNHHVDHAITIQTMQSPCRPSSHHADHAITMQTMQPSCRSSSIPSCCRGHSPAQSVSYTKQKQWCCKEFIVYCTSLTAHHAGSEGEQGVPAYPKAVS